MQNPVSNPSDSEVPRQSQWHAPSISSERHNSRCQSSATQRARTPLHASGAVDAEHLAVDPLSILGRQEAHNAGDVDRQADAVQRRPRAGILEEERAVSFLGSDTTTSMSVSRAYLVHLVVRQVRAVGDVLPAHGVVHVRLDAAGGDGVDGDLLIAEVCRGRSASCLQTAACFTVRRSLQGMCVVWGECTEVELGKIGCKSGQVSHQSPVAHNLQALAAASWGTGQCQMNCGTSDRSRSRSTLTNGHAAHKGLDGALGPGVDGMLGHALGLPRDRAHEDQPAADLEVLVRLAGDEELAARVDVEDAVELLGRDVLDVAERDDAAVGADHVELAEHLDRLVEHAHDLVHVRHVGLDRRRVRAGLLDGLHHLLGRLGAVGVVDDDLCAAAAEFEGHLSADSASWKRC